MDHIVPIILLCIAVCGAEPLNEAHRRRSVYGVYADDFTDEYEPVAMAAFPLHQPVQVLRLLSTSPIGSNFPQHKRVQHHTSVPRVQPQRDYRDQYVYAAASEPEYTNTYEQEYEQPNYASTSTQSKYTKYQSPPTYEYTKYQNPPSYESTRYQNPSSYEEYEAAAPAAPVVVYARPNKNGGFTYRHKPRPAAKPQEPVIIRVHKYKVVRD